MWLGLFILSEMSYNSHKNVREETSLRAWLIVNEFLHSNKFTEINEWLVKAAGEREILLEIKTNAEVLAVLGGAYQKRESLDFILFWDKDVRLAKYLESLGYYVVNSAESIAACDDKSMTHLLLQSKGIPMPKTVIAPFTFANIGYVNYEFLDQVEEEISYPMIVKECFGSFGMQVYLVNDRQELMEIESKIGAVPHLYQEFITSSAGKDIRLHVVGSQVVTSMYRYSVNGDFRANITNGGHMKPYEPSAEEIHLAVESAKALGLTFAGVDLLFGEDGKPLVCEVNSNAHFKNIYDCTGVNVADAIMDEILNELRNR